MNERIQNSITLIRTLSPINILLAVGLCSLSLQTRHRISSRADVQGPTAMQYICEMSLLTVEWAFNAIEIRLSHFRGLNALRATAERAHEINTSPFRGYSEFKQTRSN